jgi:hypothetical protein
MWTVTWQALSVRPNLNRQPVCGGRGGASGGGGGGGKCGGVQGEEVGWAETKLGFPHARHLGSSTFCTPRHSMPFTSRNESSNTYR